ncbi:MAG: Rieske (2Fe-2S) protein [Actinobacteria bacterium]|nr:Rieske (2Fe-2S) protein [Actinomycetota bacterium]
METEQVDVQRRTILTAGGLVLAGGALAACGGADSTATEATTGAPATWAASASATEAPAATTPVAGALASVSEIPVGGGVIVPEPPIVITQPVAGTFKAFTAICPHQGCLVSEVAENEIVCPCHGSLFSAEDGAVVQGPAVQGLTAASIAVQGDSIVLA